MFDKFNFFVNLMEFVNGEEFAVEDAKMSNYAGDVEVVGKGIDGTTITITVNIKEGNKDGN